MGNRTARTRFLDTVGNGTGTKNANVDGSVTPVEFKLVTVANEPWEIWRLLVFVRDTLAFSAEDYGNINGPLTNGISICTVDADGEIMVDLCDGVEVVSNADWSRLNYDVAPLDFGSGDNYLVVRWSFNKMGEPLHLKNGESLVITVNDDLTGLVEHRFGIQGVELGYRP